jgi:hypothetical protein
MYSKPECDNTERGRIAMNMKQPGTQHNYTELGFKHRKLPDHIWEPLLAYYAKNKNNARNENWGGRGYTCIYSIKMIISAS